MPGALLNKADGVSITFDSGFFAQILEFNWDGISREEIDTSHLGLAAPGANEIGNELSCPSDLTNPGNLEVEMHFNPDLIPPIDKVPEILTLNFRLVSPDTTPATWAGLAYMSNFSFKGALKDKITASATIKFSGPITRVLAAA